MPKIPPNQHTIFLRRLSDKVGEPILDYIKRRYEAGESQAQIRRDLGIGSHPIIRLMTEAGIERRSKSERVALQWTGNDERRTKQAEVRRAASRAYYDAGGVSPTKRPDVREKIRLAKRGEKNAMWVGDRGNAERERRGYRGPDWRIERKVVLDRDGHQCRVCHATTQLVVHHIVKYEVSQDNRPENLVTLCHSCHKHVELGHITCPLPM